MNSKWTSPQKEKGRINLADVRAVEEVDSEPLGNKPNAFQVVYQDTVARDVFVLYIVALHGRQRTEWIELIRQASERCQAKYFEVFHRGVYNVKQQAYTCCGNVDRYSKGCAPTTFCPSKEKGTVYTDSFLKYFW
ncbi:hypothetical protein LSAT2_032083 [Lamellibrachia satsuma]|nr:hypothetical protein LSAT2_032083 [Lamellibrachia satsuma]